MAKQQICPQCRRNRWIPIAFAPYCTRSCLRAAEAAAPVVRCLICQHEHDPRSAAVCFRSLDRNWECADEVACLARRRALIETMQAALDAAWQTLDRYLEVRGAQ